MWRELTGESCKTYLGMYIAPHVSFRLPTAQIHDVMLWHLGMFPEECGSTMPEGMEYITSVVSFESRSQSSSDVP